MTRRAADIIRPGRIPQRPSVVIIRRPLHLSVRIIFADITGGIGLRFFHIRLPIVNIRFKRLCQIRGKCSPVIHLLINIMPHSRTPGWILVYIPDALKICRKPAFSGRTDQKISSVLICKRLQIEPFRTVIIIAVFIIRDQLIRHQPLRHASAQIHVNSAVHRLIIAQMILLQFTVFFAVNCFHDRIDSVMGRFISFQFFLWVTLGKKLAFHIKIRVKPHYDRCRICILDLDHPVFTIPVIDSLIIPVSQHLILTFKLQAIIFHLPGQSDPIIFCHNFS